MGKLLPPVSNLHGPPVAITSPHNFVYSFDGDTQGIITFLGRNFGTATFSNPNPSLIDGILSSTNTGLASYLTDHSTANDVTTQNANPSWLVIDLGPGRSVTLSKVSLQNRNHPTDNNRAIRNFTIDGSNNPASNSVGDLDAATWNNMFTAVNDTTMPTTQYSWGTYVIPGSPGDYRWIRILQNGFNPQGDTFLCVGEIELYGLFTF